MENTYSGAEPGSLLDQHGGDVQRVLSWAFRTSARPILTTCSIFRQFQSTGIAVQGGARTGLSQHEQHAQAAAVKVAIDQLNLEQQAVIYGWHDGGRRAVALAILMRDIKAAPGFADQLKKLLILEWMDRSGRPQGKHLLREMKRMVSSGELASTYSRGQLWYARKGIFDQLDRHDLRAKEHLRERWSKA